MFKMNKFDNGCWVIVLITALFVLPIMLSGVLYQDDILRSANGEAYWGALGRPLSDVVVMAIGFGSDFVIDAFPLSLVLATSFLAASSIMLYCRFAIHRGFTSGLIFSLFSLSPFFLQNLSYHFDSLPMMLGVFLAVLPYSLFVSSLKVTHRTILSACSLVLALSLYQATINVYLSLCAVEIAYILYTRGNGLEALKVSFERAIGAILGLLIYMKGVAPLYLSKKVNSNLVISADDPTGSLSYNFDRFISVISSLFNDSFYSAWSVIFLVALIGLMVIFYRITNSNHPTSSKIIGFVVLSISILVSTFSIVGPFVFVDKTVVAPRVMMGLSGLMLLIGYLASIYNSKKITAIACVIPVIFSMSYSSAYGNASKAQRSLEDKVFYDIAVSLPKNWREGDVLISGQISTSPAADMEFKRFPSLKWMVMPIFPWSGMVMLKHYGITASIGKSNHINDGIAIKNSVYYSLIDGDGKVILLK
ncbi:glucosyltransferase domain-containing protein [Enterobacter hormaechei]|uniref:glucosyltransferase domain-containing protein n=1 Tax=Enterobacter hormaechei TaxID=158836 RepID=UPI00396ACE08